MSRYMYINVYIWKLQPMLFEPCLGLTEMDSFHYLFCTPHMVQVCTVYLNTDIDTPSISHCLSGGLLWFAIQGIL